MTLTADLEVLKDEPGFKIIMKSVLKAQIQLLMEQLSDHTGEESVILTASVTDGTLSHLGSSTAKGFLDGRDEIKSQFLGYCLKSKAHQKAKTIEEIIPSYRHTLRRKSSQATAKRGRYNPMARPTPRRTFSPQKDHELHTSLYSDDSNAGGVTDTGIKTESNSEIGQSDLSTAHLDLATSSSYDIAPSDHLLHTLLTTKPAAQPSESELELDSVKVKVEPNNDEDEDLEITGVEVGQLPQDTSLEESQLDYDMGNSSLDHTSTPLTHECLEKKGTVRRFKNDLKPATDNSLRNKSQEKISNSKSTGGESHGGDSVDTVQRSEDDMPVLHPREEGSQGNEGWSVTKPRRDGHQNTSVEVVQKNKDDMQMEPLGEDGNQGNESLAVSRSRRNRPKINFAALLRQSEDDLPMVYLDKDEHQEYDLSPREYEEAGMDDDYMDKDYIPSKDSEDENEYMSGMLEVLEPQDNSKWSDTIEKVLDEISSTCDPDERNDLIDLNPSDTEIKTKVGQENRIVVENSRSSKNASLENALHEKPQERNLSHKDLVFDEDYPKVYVKRVRNDNENSKSGRVYDRVCACLYCYKLQTNIHPHLMNKHAKEKEVMEITRLKNQISSAADEKEGMELAKELKRKLYIIRNRGNSLHNRKVLKWKKGELLVSRRIGKDSKLRVEKYGPCPNCEEWIILNSSISNHQESCPASTSKSDFHKESSVLTARVLAGKLSLKVSKILNKEVIPCIRKDNIADIAVKDDLIIGLGNLWVMKNVDNKKKRKSSSSFHMRLAARLLHELRKKKDDAQLNFQAALKPENFDFFVESSIACAHSDLSELGNNVLYHSSIPVKLGFDISRLAGLKLAHSVKMSDEVGRQEAADFIQLLKTEWSSRINQISPATLAERNFSKKKTLPDPEDIVKLVTYLVTELQKLETDLDPALADNEKFQKVVMLVQSRLLLYNRRLPGEVETLSLECCSKRSTCISDLDMSLRQQLSPLEEKILQTHELIEVRDKNGTRVPVILPSEVIPAMEYLASPVTREKSGIKEKNPFLFANSALDVIRAASSLEKSRSQCDLKFPERVYATNLRKHCATIAQVIGLKDHEMKWLCRHLGHPQKVHEQDGRSTSGVIEQLNVAKLMLIQEGNVHGKIHEKSLNDIAFEDIVSEEKETAVSVGTQVEDALLKMEDVNEMSDVGNDDHIVEDFVNDNGVDILGTKKRAKCTRKKWTEEEEAELRKYFACYFNRTTIRTCPKRRECVEAIMKSRQCGGSLHKREWDTIKKKVNNLIMKM